MYLPPTILDNPQIQVFTATGTYITPPGAVAVLVECIGAGGGGGGGAASVAGSTRRGGAGGGVGGRASQFFSAATVGASQAVTLGVGGTSGAGAAVTGAGGAGGAGGNTTFGSLLTGYGGGG